jgi:tRNA threonylcarbamoyladenosine biosynthesis protein TsaB
VTRLLAIDTASEHVSIAIGSDAESIEAMFSVASDRRHVEALVPAIRVAMDNLGLTIHDLSAVVVDIGPGLFTGMRVGLATARSFAALAEIPVVGVDSLSAVARGVAQIAPGELDEAEIVVPVLDARRGQVYWSMFRNTFSALDPLEQVRAPRVGDVDELVEDLMDRGQRSVVAGTGALRYREQLRDVIDAALVGERSGASSFALSPHVPHASVLLGIAAENVSRGLFPAAEPMYLRPPDAEINWITR